MIRKLALGTVLHFFREDKGLSRQKLAELCGWKDKRIEKYERGKSEPGLESLERIAAELGRTTSDLLEGRDAVLTFLVSIGYVGWEKTRERPSDLLADEVAERTTVLPGDLHEEWLQLLEDEEALRRRQGTLARRRDELQHKIWIEFGPSPDVVQREHP